jgi:endonuclease III
MTRLDLKEVVAELAASQAPARAPMTDPFEIILYEAVGYLIDDEPRQVLFEALRSQIGLDPKAIVSAPDEALLGITRRGGMHPDKRAERLRSSARIVLGACGGDLAAALAGLPLAKARALLKQFDGLGDPGADRILLFGGYAAVPAVDSNGLRALVRMGFCLERPSWSSTYKDAVAVLASQGEPEREWLMSAWLALREHGKALCKRSRPQCLACPFDELCAHAVTSSL